MSSVDIEEYVMGFDNIKNENGHQKRGHMKTCEICGKDKILVDKDRWECPDNNFDLMTLEFVHAKMEV